MKRSFLFLMLFIVCASVLAETNGNVASVQNRLKVDGFYQGNPTGIFDSETATALLRFQKRHGLTMSGKLDAPTARELNASAPKPSPTPEALTGSWHRLPSGEMEFVPAPLAGTPTPTAAARFPVPSPSPSPPRAQPIPPAEGPPLPQNVAESQRPPPLPSPTPPPGAPAGTANENSVRDYVDAFVRAGLAQPQGSELKFFAERVDYLGAPNVPRQQIQQDLLRYDRKWPHRQFWIDGDIQIEQQSGSNEIKFAFPLRYELRNGSRQASGRVLKTLTVIKTATDEMKITAVNEWRMP